MGNGVLQSVLNSSSLLFLPPAFPPLHGLQSCMNHSWVSPLHQVTVLQEKKSALLWAVQRLQCRYLLQCGPLHKLQGNAFSTMVFLMAYRLISSPAPGAHFFCPHPSLTWVITLLFLTVSGVFVCLFYLLFCLSSIFSFLKHIFSEAPPAFLMGSSVPSGEFIGTVWNQLYPTWDSPGLPSQRPPCQDSAMETQYISKILEIELPQFFKDFGVNFDPTENSIYYFRNLIWKKFQDTKLVGFLCLYKNGELLFSLCTTNIVCDYCHQDIVLTLFEYFHVNYLNCFLKNPPHPDFFFF